MATVVTELSPELREYFDKKFQIEPDRVTGGAVDLGGGFIFNPLHIFLKWTGGQLMNGKRIDFENVVVPSVGTTCIIRPGVENPSKMEQMIHLRQVLGFSWVKIAAWMQKGEGGNENVVVGRREGREEGYIRTFPPEGLAAVFIKALEEKTMDDKLGKNGATMKLTRPDYWRTPSELSEGEQQKLRDEVEMAWRGRLSAAEANDPVEQVLRWGHCVPESVDASIRSQWHDYLAGASTEDTYISNWLAGSHGVGEASG